MRIAINPIVERHEPEAFRRNSRRLLYLAQIAADLGHGVWLVPVGAEGLETLRRPEMTPWLLALAESFPRSDTPPANVDLIICSNSQATRTAARYPGVRLVVFKEDLLYRRDRQLVGIADLIPCCVWRRSDFTQCAERPADEPDHEEIMRPVVMQVPWLPHDRILLQLEEDGLARAYLGDDLESIRGRYAGGKRRRIGFIGADIPETRRRALGSLRRTGLLDECRTYAPAEWTMPAADYLHWLTECRAVPEVPGDQWNCYRFAEAVMMGVPVIRLGGKAEYTPPLARSNCILIEDWGDRAAIEEGMERSEPIVAEADRCYRTGWSLRGQLCQIFARLGLVEARIHSPQVTASRDKNPVLMAQSGTAPSQPMGEPIP